MHPVLSPLFPQLFPQLPSHRRSRQVFSPMVALLLGMVMGLSAPASVLAAALPVTGKGQPGSITSTPPDMTYFAMAGDTLSSIAQQFTDNSANWAALGKRNNIANDRTIPVGSAILIPLALLPEQASEAKVVAIAGQASSKKKDGVESAIALGDILTEGSLITTGKNGFLSLALADESRISLPSNSQISLSKLRMSKYTKSPRTQIHLSQGRVESKVSVLVSNKGRFEVTSPLAIAGVRGTHFRVGINDSGIANEVLSGGVAVGKKNQPEALILPAGKGNIISDNNVGKAIDLLAAPVLSGNFQLQEKPTLQFSVVAMSAARAYRAQIASDAGAQNILMESRISGERFKFDGLVDGQYFARVTAIDVNGLEGVPTIQALTLKARPEPPFSVQPKTKLRAEVVNFVWTEAANASRYRLQVASDAEFNNIVIDQSDITGVQFAADKLAYGKYFWRLASITMDKPGGKTDQGPFSDIQTLHLQPPQAMNPVGDTGGHLLSFNWPSEPGQAYLIEIATDANFKTRYLSRELSQPEISLPRPEAGTYYIRVRASDADGYVGAFSATQKVRIFTRWVSGNGEPVNSSAGEIRPGF